MNKTAMVETLREKAKSWDQKRGVAFSYDGVSTCSSILSLHLLHGTWLCLFEGIYVFFSVSVFHTHIFLLWQKIELFCLVEIGWFQTIFLEFSRAIFYDKTIRVFMSFRESLCPNFIQYFLKFSKAIFYDQNYIYLLECSLSHGLLILCLED